jgi:hypothetical protein
VIVGDRIVFHRDDLTLIAAFAGCSLDEKPGSNWVQGAGGLPEYLCEVARAIKRSGKTTSQAIAIAVSRIKKWATGAGVDKDTQAKAAKALAEWEKLRAKSHAKSAAKKGKDVVNATHATTHVSAHVTTVDILCLSGDYNVDQVRCAFDNRIRQQRNDWSAANPGRDMYEDGPPRLWVRELWNTFLIAQSSHDSDASLYKVPYTVDSKGEVTFGAPAEVRTEYVAVPADEVDDTGIDDTTLQALAASMPGCQFSPFLAMTPRPGALDRIVAFAVSRDQ